MSYKQLFHMFEWSHSLSLFRHVVRLLPFDTNRQVCLLIEWGIAGLRWHLLEQIIALDKKKLTWDLDIFSQKYTFKYPKSSYPYYWMSPSIPLVQPQQSWTNHYGDRVDIEIRNTKEL